MLLNAMLLHKTEKIRLGSSAAPRSRTLIDRTLILLGILSVLSTADFFFSPRFLRDPFAAHRRQMRSVFGTFGFDPFPLNPQIQSARAPMQVQVRAHVSIIL